MRQRGATAVQAPPEAIFEALERDRTGLNNDDLVRHDSVGDLAYGLGYRFVTRRFHGDHICSTMTRVTAFDAPRVVFEEWEHECPLLARPAVGSQRFEIVVDQGGTILVCDARFPGSGPLQVFGALLCNQARGLAKEIGMRAEALVLSRR